MYLGLDIGGTSLKLGAWEGQRRLAWQTGIEVTASKPAAVADAIAEAIFALDGVDSSAAVALGIGSCGLISHGVILQSPNTPWDRVELAELLYSRLDCPVHLINDADAFLIDALDVLDSRPPCAIGITLGTGVGTAIWLHGQLMAGGSGISPEGGHITLDVHGAPANTGIPGSWESMAGRDALVRYFSEAGGGGADTPLAIAQLAKQGNPQALTAWALYGRYVGAGLAGFCNIFSPQHILIGGGLAGAHGLFSAALDKALALHMLASLEPPRIHYLNEREDSVARGAARYAMLRSDGDG
jgi:glucokinase